MGADRDSVTAAEQAPYRKLIRLIEHELELAGAGRGEELQAAVLETGAYMETLPHPAPTCAIPLVLRAEALRARVTIETERLRESIGLRRTSLKRGRRVARSYAPPRPDRYTTSA